MPLLQTPDPPAFQVERPEGAAPFILACDHASSRLPLSLGTLGLTEAERSTHVGWDIGAAAVAKLLSAQLDATVILQNYSRLAIDCNRPPGVASSIAERSEATAIPGNMNLGDDARAEREREIFWPYHHALSALLERREAQHRRSVLVAIHSFTPVYHGVARPWDAGVMYRHDSRLARALLRGLRAFPALVIGDNEPYAVSEQTDYTLPVHGERRGLLHVGIELRQDRVGDTAGQAQWAARLAQALVEALARLDHP